MKFTSRDMCWLIVLLGIMAGWGAREVTWFWYNKIIVEQYQQALNYCTQEIAKLRLISNED